MKIFTLFCFVLFTFAACGEKPKSTVHEVVIPNPMTADATPVPVAPDMLDAEMSMDATPTK